MTLRFRGQVISMMKWKNQSCLPARKFSADGEVDGFYIPWYSTIGILAHPQATGPDDIRSISWRYFNRFNSDIQ